MEDSISLPIDEAYQNEPQEIGFWNHVESEVWKMPHIFPMVQDVLRNYPISSMHAFRMFSINLFPFSVRNDSG